MPILPDALGRLVVQPGEQITLFVTKLLNPYLAQVSPIQGASSWMSVMQPTPLSEMRLATAPTTSDMVFAFDIRFDFQPDASGAHDMTDQYTVQITGGASGTATPDVIQPPPIVSRAYVFVTA